MAPSRPLSLKKSNGLELLNADVLSNFRHRICSASAFAHYNTLKQRKIYSYSDFRKIEKTPIVHHLFFLLQFKRPTAKLGLVIALFFSWKSFYWSVHDPWFPKSWYLLPKPSNSRSESFLEVLFLDAIFLFAHAKFLMCDSALTKLEPTF